MEITDGVLACIDGSRYGAAVCDYAAWMSLGLDVPLTLLHNIERHEALESPDLSGAIGLGSQESLLDELTTLEAQRSRLMMNKGKLMLNAARDRVIDAGVKSPEIKQRHDGQTESLIAFEEKIRVLVLAIRGDEHASDDSHLGPHLESTIRSLHRPILVVNCEFKEPKQIMLAYDGSPASEKAVDLLIGPDRFAHLPVHLITVGESAANAARFLGAAVDKVRGAGHHVTAVALDGEPSQVLRAYQKENDIDLTLMGAFSHTRLRDWMLGSMTVKMLLSSDRPLLLLR